MQLHPSTGLILAGGWQGAGCISPWEAHGVCLAGMAGTCPLSRACSAVYNVLVGLFFPVRFGRCCQLQSWLLPMNVLVARPLENKAKLHLFVLLALLKTKRCQALLALLGVFQQSLCLTETGPITLACSPEEGVAGRCASCKGERTPGWASLLASSSWPLSVQLGLLCLFWWLDQAQ